MELPMIQRPAVQAPNVARAPAPDVAGGSIILTTEDKNLIENMRAHPALCVYLVGVEVGLNPKDARAFANSMSSLSGNGVVAIGRLLCGLADISPSAIGDVPTTIPTGMALRHLKGIHTSVKEAGSKQEIWGKSAREMFDSGAVDHLMLGKANPVLVSGHIEFSSYFGVNVVDDVERARGLLVHVAPNTVTPAVANLAHCVAMLRDPKGQNGKVVTKDNEQLTKIKSDYLRIPDTYAIRKQLDPVYANGIRDWYNKATKAIDQQHATKGVIHLAQTLSGIFTAAHANIVGTYAREVYDAAMALDRDNISFRPPMEKWSFEGAKETYRKGEKMFHKTLAVASQLCLNETREKRSPFQDWGKIACSWEDYDKPWTYGVAGKQLRALNHILGETPDNARVAFVGLGAKCHIFLPARKLLGARDTVYIDMVATTGVPKTAVTLCEDFLLSEKTYDYVFSDALLKKEEASAKGVMIKKTLFERTFPFAVKCGSLEIPLFTAKLTAPSDHEMTEQRRQLMCNYSIVSWHPGHCVHSQELYVTFRRRPTPVQQAVADVDWRRFMVCLSQMFSWSMFANVIRTTCMVMQIPVDPDFFDRAMAACFPAEFIAPVPTLTLSAADTPTAYVRSEDEVFAFDDLGEFAPVKVQSLAQKAALSALSETAGEDRDPGGSSRLRDGDGDRSSDDIEGLTYNF